MLQSINFAQFIKKCHLNFGILLSLQIGNLHVPNEENSPRQGCVSVYLWGKVEAEVVRLLSAEAGRICDLS